MTREPERFQEPEPINRLRNISISIMRLIKQWILPPLKFNVQDAGSEPGTAAFAAESSHRSGQQVWQIVYDLG